MAEAVYAGPSEEQKLTLEAAISSGEVYQMPDGQAGVYQPQAAAILGAYATLTKNGKYVFTKATGFVALAGGRAYWDHSANNVTYFQQSDRDFYLGRFVSDAATGDTTCTVDITVPEWSHYKINNRDNAFISAITGTQALGGCGIAHTGGRTLLTLDTTNEVQKVDLLSLDSFAAGGANGIVEMMFNYINNGSGSEPDFNIGIASATHATDADSIAQHFFLHLDGNSLDLYAQSKDGTTTVSATDTTINVTEAADATGRVEVWIDLRAPAAAKVYVNGSRVLSGTTFDVSAAASAWKLLAHLEKTSSASVAQVAIDWLAVRTSQQ